MNSLRVRRYSGHYLSILARPTQSAPAEPSQTKHKAITRRASVVTSLDRTSRLENSAAHPKYGSVIIIGGGIAGLSTARYLLRHDKRIRITIIDKNTDIMPNQSTSYPSYVQQQINLMHCNIPSRRNGNMLCPSLTIPWTTRSLWSEAFLPLIKSYFAIKNEKGRAPPTISFDFPSFILDRNMWSFASHFLMQKFFHSRPELQSNKSILEYNMKCLDDPSDELVQRIDFGRCAKGTRLLDGSIVESDSSGDIGLFCQGLLYQLSCEYGDSLSIVHGEEATSLEEDGELIRGVTVIAQDGHKKTRKADAVVVACGIGSTFLCSSLNVPCPVYPAKGHLATVASKVKSEYNITLPGGVGYAAPMAMRNMDDRYLYRLSGFVDFNLNKQTNLERIEALLDAARVHLPDLELIDASACHRPISADDRPIVGLTKKYSNLFLCTGFGSRGWSVGLGCGKLLSSIILGLRCEIDATPFLPTRFS